MNFGPFFFGQRDLSFSRFLSFTNRVTRRIADADELADRYRNLPGFLGQKQPDRRPPSVLSQKTRAAKCSRREYLRTPAPAAAAAAAAADVEPFLLLLL